MLFEIVSGYDKNVSIDDTIEDEVKDSVDDIV